MTAGLDRNSVAAAISALLAGLPPPSLLQDVAPAGLPFRLASNSKTLFQSYVTRLAGRSSVVPQIEIHASVAPHLPPWCDASLAPAHFHRLLGEAGLRAAYPFRPGVWQLFDPVHGHGALLVDREDRLPPWDSGAPLRQHLHWMLGARGMRVAHAASLGEDGVGVLFLGNSGAGKSGIALAGLSVGLSSVGDDYLGLGHEDGEIVARPLYRIVKQDRLGLSRVPQLADVADSLALNWKGKAELDPEEHFPGAFAERLAIRAIVLPRIAHADRPSLSAATPGEAMRALMRSNLHQFPGEADDGMRFFGGMLRQLPVHRLDLSENFPRNGELVRTLLRSL
jgi:hypothetical protein